MKLLAASAALSLMFAAMPVAADASTSYGTPQSYGLAWGLQSDIGWGGNLTAIDVADGVVWSVGEGNAVNDGNSDALIERSSIAGADLGHLVEGDAKEADTARGLDAGPWGAVVTGSTSGVFPGSGVTPPNYGEHGWVQLLDPAGNVSWTTEFDEDYIAYINGVVVDGNTVVVVGTSYPSNAHEDMEVDTFDLATGAPLASRNLGTPTDDSARAVTALDGEIVIGGSTGGQMGSTPAAGGADAVIVALDPTDLTTLWTTQIGTAGGDAVGALTSRNGTIYWGGAAGDLDDADVYSASIGAVGAVSSTGKPLWQDNLGPQGAFIRSITTTSRGVVLGGQIEPAGTNRTEGYLEGRGFDGTPQWHLALSGGGYYDLVEGVVAPADRVFFAGTTYDGIFGPVDKGSDALLGALDVANVLNPDLEVVPPATHPPGTTRTATKTSTTGATRIVVHAGSTSSTVVGLHNDGLVPDTLALRGCTGPHLHMTWLAGHHNISATTRAGTYRTPQLRPGRTQHLLWRIKADKAAQGTITCTLTARSTHDAKAVDHRQIKILVKPAL